MMKPTAIVCNMDAHTKPGSHWIGIFINSDGLGTYFDSYGMPPISNHHLDRLKRNSTSFEWNAKKLQSDDSMCCGQYAIMFLYHMSRGKSLKEFCKIFTRDTRKNDAIVTAFHRKLCEKLKNKKCTRIRSFPKESRRGSGYCIQSCTSKL